MGKVTVVGGKVEMKVPSTMVLASELAVGSKVYLKENGIPVEYIVINQGIPSQSSLYDSSCDGTWLLLNQYQEDHVWYDGDDFDYYAGSDIHAFLNNDYLNRFDSITQNAIKQVKIPYVSTKTTVDVGGNGLDAKLFLLSCAELGIVTTTYNTEGAKVDYFLSGNGTYGSEDAEKRKWENKWWWLRTPQSSIGNAQLITSDGITTSGVNDVENPNALRPALVLDSNTLFNSKTLLFEGVS